MEIYVVETVNENYDIYKDVILVTVNKDEAISKSRIRADGSYLGTELTTWVDGVKTDKEVFKCRDENEIVFSKVPALFNDYDTTKQYKAKLTIEEGLDCELIIISNSCNFAEYLEDYQVSVSYKEMTFEEYTEYRKDSEEHFIICDYFDESKLTELK